VPFLIDNLRARKSYDFHGFLIQSVRELLSLDEENLRLQDKSERMQSIIRSDTDLFQGHE
jgi:hypothetical protein